MTDAVEQWLRKHGHTPEGFCPKCWQRAGALLASGAFDDRQAAYRAAMDEAEGQAKDATEEK